MASVPVQLPEGSGSTAAGGDQARQDADVCGECHTSRVRCRCVRTMPNSNVHDPACFLADPTPVSLGTSTASEPAQVQGGGQLASNTMGAFDVYFADLIESDILTSFRCPTFSGGSVPHVFKWSEILGWSQARETMAVLGFQEDGQTDFEKIGLSSDHNVITVDLLEHRRRLLNVVTSAMEAHSWGEIDKEQGRKWVNTFCKIIDNCHKLLPAISKKTHKKKKNNNAGGPETDVMLWCEPSPLVYEFCLKAHSATTIALFLSNLQRIPIDTLCTTLCDITGRPRVLSCKDTRDLCTRLSQTSAKIEEALRLFNGGRLILWAPDRHDQIPRILQSLKKLYTEEGVAAQLQFLVPYTPFPGCHTAASIMDIWSHQLLHPRFADMVSEICFIREPSRCVFTRNSNPIHMVKNLMAVTVQASISITSTITHSMREELLSREHEGDCIVVDVPAQAAMEYLKALRELGSRVTCVPSSWHLQARSKGHSDTHKRSLLLGYSDTKSLIEVQAIIAIVRKSISSRHVIVGRASMFADANTIVAEGNIEQIVSLYPMLLECVFISPYKALVTPSSSAEQMSKHLTEEEGMRTVSLRYRRSSALQGEVFARPRDLASHLRAERHAAYASRQCQEEKALLLSQVQIEVLGLRDCSSFPNLAGNVMQAIGVHTGIFSFSESPDPNEPLKVGEWRAIARDGGWSGRVIVQCANIQDMRTFYTTTHGMRACINGMHCSIDISSLANPFLAAEALAQAQGQRLDQ